MQELVLWPKEFISIRESTQLKGPLCLCCSLYGGPNDSDNDGDDSNDNSFYCAVHTRLGNCCNDNDIMISIEC